MIIEDYYGFSQNKSDSNQLPRENSSNRTEKSKGTRQFVRKSPIARTLKRTELSNQKLNSKDSKKAKRFAPPELPRQQTSRREPSGVRMTIHEQEVGSSRSQQIEMMVRKYDNYKNTDSYEFKDPEGNGYNRSSYLHDSQNHDNYNQRGYRFEKEAPARRNRLQNEGEEQYYDRDYRSASRGKNQQLLVHFQREGPAPNPIERYTQNRSNSNDIRAKKSRSLGAKLRPYKMHTFYNAERRQYYNYNEEGYMTDRQYELLNRIEEKALRAFDKAAAESSTQKAPEVKKQRLRHFDIKNSSKIQHEHSGILSSLNKEEGYEGTPISSRREQGKDPNKNKKEQRVLEVSINPKSGSSKQYDDYQMSISSKNKEEKLDDLEIMELSKSMPKSVKKDIFQNFAKEESEQDSSFLEFKPVKAKETKEADNPDPIEREDSVKRSSSISNDYKSIDMMEINSNYKPNNKELKQRNDFIVDENRSLGMDTIRNRQVKKKEVDEESERDSNLEVSQSKSSGSSSSSALLSDSSKSASQKKSSKKGSIVSPQLESDPKFDFAKNKVKKSYSMSEQYSESSLNDNSKKGESKDIAGNFKKAAHPLSESQKLVSSNSVSVDANNTSNSSQKKIKIKRLTKAPNKTISESEQQIIEDNMEALGVQSFAQYDNIEAIKIKVSPSGKSKISERSPNSEMEPSINVRSASKLREKPSSSSFKQRSQASIAYRSKARGSQYVNSNVEYDLFGQIRDFIEMEQVQYNQPRRAQQVKSLISDQLDDVIYRIEDHLYIVNCIAEIILLVPDVYDFETIYDKSKGWIFYQIFLTFKKFIFERNRVIVALKGGKNCFNLLNYIIEDHILKKYLSRVEIMNILHNLEECQVKLDKLMSQFYNFLINFNKEGFGGEPSVNLKPFKMNEDLVALISEYMKEVETLKKKKEEEFKGGEISPDDEDEFEMLVILNERIFRLMEMTFVMANLAGREIKEYEKEENLFREEEQFKTYMFQNEDLFRETIKYFK